MPESRSREPGHESPIYNDGGVNYQCHCADPADRVTSFRNASQPIWPLQPTAPCNPNFHWLLLAVCQKNSANQIKGFKHFINGWLLTTRIQIFPGISQFLIAVHVYTMTRLWTMASSDRVSTRASYENDDSLL